MFVVLLAVAFSSKHHSFGEEAVGQLSPCFDITPECDALFAGGTAEDNCKCLQSQSDSDCILFADVTVEDEFYNAGCSCPDSRPQSCMEWEQSGFSDEGLMCICLEEQPNPDCTPDGSLDTLRQIKEASCDCMIMTSECQASMEDPKSAEKKCACFFSQEGNMECRPKAFEGGTRSFVDLASDECQDHFPACIDEGDYRGSAGECSVFESAKYQGFCLSDSMRLLDNGIEELMFAWESCPQCGLCTSANHVAPTGSNQFCNDKLDEEFVPLCGSCLYSSQCIGHVDSFNPDDRAHEIYCCPRTKMCMLAREVPGENYKMGSCTREDIAATREYLGDPSWTEKYAGCVHTRTDNRCSERHAAYPDECVCEDATFPGEWVECPTQSSLLLMYVTEMMDSSMITKAFALIGAFTIVYAGFQKMKGTGAKEEFEKIEEPEDI